MATQIQKDHEAAFRQQLAVAGEEVLVDGRPFRGVVSDLDEIQSLGSEGEVDDGRLQTVTIPWGEIDDRAIEQGCPVQVRGRDLEVISTRAGTSYLQITVG